MGETAVLETKGELGAATGGESKLGVGGEDKAKAGSQGDETITCSGSVVGFLKTIF